MLEDPQTYSDAYQNKRRICPIAALKDLGDMRGNASSSLGGDWQLFNRLLDGHAQRSNCKTSDFDDLDGPRDQTNDLRFAVGGSSPAC